MPDNLFDDETKDERPDESPVGSDASDVDDTEYELIEPLLLTAEAAADLLGIGKTTLRELVRRDRLRCVEFVATGFKRPIRRFRMADLKAFAEEHIR